MRRVFKLKTFARWARRVLPDDVLCKAAGEIEQGLYEADLGGGICKKRVAVPGRGKSGSTRILVARQHKDAIFFLAGREKSQPGADFSASEVDAAKIVANSLVRAGPTKLDALIATELLKEICHGKQEAH